MKSRTKKTQSGQALLSFMVATVVASISTVALVRNLRSHGNAERGIASNLDLDEVARVTTMIIDNPQACVISGLLGKDISSLVAAYTAGRQTTDADLVRVVLSLSPGITIGPGAIYGSRSVTSTVLSSVASAGGPQKYIATLDVGTTVAGKAMTSRSPSKRFAVYLEVDNNNLITKCGGSGGGSGSGGNPPPAVGIPWTFKLTRSNAGAFLAPSLFTQDYTVPVGKTLVIDTVDASIPEGWVDCNIAKASMPTRSFFDFAVSHVRAAPGVAVNYIPMTNTQTFSGGTTIRFGAGSRKLTAGGNPATYTCQYMGFLYDDRSYPVQGDFVGFYAFDAPLHPNNIRYTVPAGKTLVISGSVAAILDNQSMTCTIDFNAGTDFTYTFSQTPGTHHTAITTPLQLAAGTTMTFRARANGRGLLNWGKCSWTGYLK